MKFNKIIPYIVALSIFVLFSIIYFNPVLRGQKLSQSDIVQFEGIAKEIKDYRAKNKSEPYWTGTSFSGMPAYQISAYYPCDFIRSIDLVLRFLPRPADYTFLYFLGFFILMMALKIDWRLAIIGALSFGFSTYLIVILGVGHNAKAHAIAYMPLVLSGVLWVFQKKYTLGFCTTAIAMALEIYTNHPQMTYYLGFILLFLGLIEFRIAFKDNSLLVFYKKAAIIIVSIMLAIGVNATRLLAMKEYSIHSTRGKSELTIKPNGDKKVVTTGLEKSYITEYSYSKLETFNLFVPRFMGGGTVEKLGENSKFYKTIEAKVNKKAAIEYSKQAPTYWGDQPILEAPAYIGAVIFFLFFIGLFLVKGKYKHWLVSASIFSILMSWGRNFEVLTNFFIDYMPLYNKFRAVSSIQVIAELCVPTLAILALKEFFTHRINYADKLKALKKATYTFAGLIFIGYFLANIFGTFQGIRDQQYSQLPGLIDAIISDRKSILLYDSLRSLALVFITASILWLTLNNKLKHNISIIIIGVLTLFDLISVDKKYVNESNFKPSKKIDVPFVATESDKLILKDTTYFRVGNFTVNPMNDATTSYFHHSIGGYHATKLIKYQELFDYQIAKNNRQVLNMLNTKYIIFTNDKREKQVQINSSANGNAWFVNKILKVNSANDEIFALDTINTKNTAVISNEFLSEKELNFSIENDDTNHIELTNYSVNSLKYSSKTNKKQFAVFSEIYYKNGWNAYINGKLTPHYRVNYVLRGMLLPAGKNIIEFKFEPNVIQKGKIISLISYVFLILAGGVCWFVFIKRNNLKKHSLKKNCLN